MKRLWIGIGVLVGILLLGIWLSAAFFRHYQPMAQQFQQAAKAALTQDWETASALTQGARAQWRRGYRWASAAADHQPLEQMESLMAQLSVYERAEDETRFAAVCLELASLARAMADSQQLRWWNLLSGVCR